MRKNRIFGLVSAILLLAAGASCSNDALDPNKSQNGLLNTDENAGGVYLSVDFQLPSDRGVSRSHTVDPDPSTGSQSNDGTEVGLDAENYVSSALIVLAATEAYSNSNINIEKYGYIVAGEVPSNRIQTATTSLGGKQYKATARLQKENLNDIYTAYGDGNVPEVYVFVFANPTTELISLFGSEKNPFGSAAWINETCEVIQTTDASQSKNVGIWGTNSFLMNNVKLTKRELPKTLLEWENFSSVEKPFHLSDKNDNSVDNSYDYDKENPDRNPRGTILVERSVARFDFKDGSNTSRANTYNVLLNTNSEGDFDEAQPIVDIEIDKMCLVNMSNKFYYLPRVSPNGQDQDIELCGFEKPWTRVAGVYSGGNYVVGPYAKEFGGSTIMTGFETYFNFPFFDENGSFNNETMSSTRWDVVKVDDVLKGNQDQKKEYHIWRYVTENLIPENESKQVNGISTGVVFKGKMIGSEVSDGTTYYEEAWNEGNIANIQNCLNGKSFTYNGEIVTLKGNSKEDPILYYYSGHLYMGWRHIRQAAIQASVTINTAGNMEINRSNSLYKAVFGDGPIPTYTQDGKENHMVYVDPSDGQKKVIDDPMWAAAQADTSGPEWDGYIKSANYAWSLWALNGKETSEEGGANVSETLKNMRLAVTGAGITIYQSSNDDSYGPGYYCYYYYWNRHNDNGLPGSMGPMEFDVVRNNVYKLSIENIARLGHPRIPENDPNNPTPDTPDESDEIYLDVRMEILPWVVRKNEISF